MAKKEKKSFWNSVGSFFKKMANKICAFFVLTYHELRRMRWPSKKVLVRSSYIVLSFIFVLGAFIILDDFIIAEMINLVY